jgi:hypothetical protein
LLSEVKAAAAQLLQDAGVAQSSSVKAVILEGIVAEAPAGKGPVDRSRLWSDADAVSLLGPTAVSVATSPTVVRAEPEDAAVGGCVLSAAELSSSKQYLQRKDGEWAIAYQVLLNVSWGYCLPNLIDCWLL